MGVWDFHRFFSRIFRLTWRIGLGDPGDSSHLEQAERMESDWVTGSCFRVLFRLDFWER